MTLGTQMRSSMEKIDLSRKKLFLFDLDGVFYRGKENRVKIGGTRIVSQLRKRGKKLTILTNNSTDTVETVRDRLAEFDVRLDLNEVMTSGRATAEYLRSRFGPVEYFLLGEAGLEAELRSQGHRRTNGLGAGFVVVGLDRRLTYRKLDRAAAVVRGGASIVATHASPLYMYKDGPALASGPILKALEYATGTSGTVIGKPSPIMFKTALERAGVRASDAVMVGDQLDTDIEGAGGAGIESVLVLTGLDHPAKRKGLLGSVGNVDDLADCL
ncbi:MAG: HAD-IIA family hydrolase [Nitrososphaerota archaeon]|jgi:HAD superfamily hydrolase (TIGR01450 family)|nr:HAD-IIA family hydrolase [Nitrososphaerota archaeon]MDG6962790.1 HAD-IIA family hydrolase [Nitrososphaerota archaeon]MDG6970101.1 HAD-IIA family hydrolase [Nitrososphaerota archaeon]MDG6984837.1 HAD-IIA family hydrolase [Nitrososphaerota archaeon]MDG6986282.1 HAD-IIA family hydrolase [Nitrososphaerota archaeon]